MALSVKPNKYAAENMKTAAVEDAFAPGPDSIIGSQIDPDRRRGRGVLSNSSGRFESESRYIFDDGWNSIDDLPNLKTEVQTEHAKKIITRNNSPDISFDRSINPYRGCEHGCVYCYARPTHTYMGMSAGLDFETRLFAKPNAAELLRQEISNSSYVVKPIAIGTNTDAYQPIEKRMRIMRQILEVLSEAGHPVGIVTKSTLVLRDLDILKSLAERNLVKVFISVTTLDRKLARSMEPRAATPAKRLEALRILSDAGVPTGSLIAPIIPALNDAEIEDILEALYENGVREAGYVLLRLPLEVRDLFREWLRNNYPNKYLHVMSVLKSMRGGKDYDADWSQRMRGKGPYADLIHNRFRLAMGRLGFNKRRLRLDTEIFRAPMTPTGQLDFF
ncbi:MAG: PA0069 family radical SAM protein [Cohaesibacteraceae bacterium]|nr:PA0069 family radical SAM protein [Cohaesibacteraceae bacterium]